MLCPCCGGLKIVISDDSRRGSVVRIRLTDPADPSTVITPRMIAAAASQALAHGWVPGQGKGVFLAVPFEQVMAAIETASGSAPSSVERS